MARGSSRRGNPAPTDLREKMRRGRRPRRPVLDAGGSRRKRITRNTAVGATLAVALVGRGRKPEEAGDHKGRPYGRVLDFAGVRKRLPCERGAMSVMSDK